MPGAAIVDVTDQGALGDVKSTTGSIDINSTTLSVPPGVFGPDDVGKQIMIVGAGGEHLFNNGETAVVPLFSVISEVKEGTVTLATSAAAGVTGAVVQWGTDDTDSFTAAGQAVQAAGGGELRIPPATYWLFSPAKPAPPKNGSGACDFTGLAGIRIVGHGATLLTARLMEIQEFFNLFTFQDCRNVDVRGMHVQGHLLSGGERVVQNAVLVRLFGNCRNVDVAADCTGIMTPLMVTAGPRGNDVSNNYAGVDSQRSRGIRVAVNTLNCGYGANFQFSGDDVEARVVTDGCYRSYFLYGARDHRAMVDSRNHVGADVLLQAYTGRAGPGAPDAGYGVENVSVTFTDRETTAPWMAGNGTASVELGFGDNQEAVHRDIRVHYDVRYNEEARFGPVLRVNNSSDLGTFKGVHRLERLRLEGRVEGSSPAGNFDFNFDRRVVSPEKAYGHFHDLAFSGLTLTDAGDQAIDLTPLEDFAEFHNVVSDAGIAVQTAGAASVRWVGCRAPALSYTATDALPADYVDCVIGSWERQSTLGKTFRNTTVGGFPLEIERWEGVVHRQAAAFRTGDLASWFDAFRVRHPGAGAAYRLHYYVSASPNPIAPPPLGGNPGPLQEQLDSITDGLQAENLGFRRELAGVATWSALMSADGTSYALQLPVDRLDRILGPGSPFVDVKLEAGSGFGTVQLSVQGLGGPAVQAAFRLEVLGPPVRDVVPL